MVDTIDEEPIRPSRTVTLKDIAEQCGLGIATVSMALRDHQRFPQVTTQRILAAAAELGYDPSRQTNARRLVMSRFGKPVINNLLALFLPPHFYRAPYYTAQFQGILDVATREGYGVMAVNAPVSGLTRLPPSFHRGEVDGAILMVGWKYSEQILTQLRQEPLFGRRPVVSIMAAVPDCSTVMTDAQVGAAAEVTHLLALGHRHFVTFHPPGGTTFGFHQDQLLLGYRQACLDYGLDPTRHLHAVEIDATLWRLAFVAAEITKIPRLPMSAWSTRHPLLTLLRQHPEITAVLAPNDPFAVVVRQILARGDFRVPDDISLVGFDDTDEMLDTQGHNLLTTVRLPLRKFGRRATQLLIDRLLGRATADVQMVIPAKLIGRSSTACAKVRH
ncbi:MAG TPA: LacI family DNA-binding transcriptional regulator [Armatimonadota bacterium]